jgi:CDP-paratose 2-epimerase
MGTEDQGWVAHFLIRALEGQSITIYGDGKQVRDVLHVDDAVDTYLAALRSIDRVSGRVFNLGGGPDNAISLRQLLLHIETLTGHPVETRWEEWRAGDQRYFVADARRARETLGLGAPKPWQQGIADLAEWLAKSRGLALHTGHMEAAE